MAKPEKKVVPTASKDEITKEIIEITKENEITENYTTSTSTTYPTSQPLVNNPAYDPTALMDMIAKLQKQVEDLTKEKEAFKNKSNEEEQNNPSSQIAIPVPIPVNHDKDTSTKLLEYLTSKKSDREVIIVHNQEKTGGLATSIQLTGLQIDFHTMGEQRVLSWQQFEECVSKYKKWFDKKIIVVSGEDRDLAIRYNVPYQGQDGVVNLDRQALSIAGTLSVNELEKFFNKLDREDKNNFCSYWIGKCYERVPEYYDRYKVELLNRISGCNAFDNILVNMNYDFMKDNKSNTTISGQVPTRQIPRINSN